MTSTLLLSLRKDEDYKDVSSNRKNRKTNNAMPKRKNRQTDIQWSTKSN